MPTVKLEGVKVTTVRQTPLMAMLSPSWQSERRVEASGREMVRDVPPVESFGLSSATTGRGLLVYLKSSDGRYKR